MKAALPFFSPNKDGVQDVLTIGITAERLKKVSNWEFRVQDAAGSTKRTITGVKTLPAAIDWDGLDDFGAAVSEGNYHATLVAWDTKEGILTAPSLTAGVDVTPPTVSLSQNKNAPKGDGGVHFLASAVDLSGIDHWKLEFQDWGGKSLNVQSSSGSVPSNLLWIPDKTVDLPGRGVAILTVADRAGNRGSSPPVELEFVQEVPRTVPREFVAFKSSPPPPAKKYFQMTTILSVSDLFGPDAARGAALRREAASALDPLVQALAQNPGARAVVLGHVDTQKTVQDTRSLSSYFAWRAFSYFVKDKGIEKDRVSVKGLGNDVPLAREDTPAGRSRNRRIEIQIFFPE